MPRRVVEAMNTDISQYLGVLLLFAAIIGAVLGFVYFQVSFESNVQQDILKSTLWTVFFILSIIAAIAAWVFVLVHESRRVAEEETQRQTELLMQEIDAHKRTDAKLQQEIEAVVNAWLEALNRADGKAAGAFFLANAPVINPAGLVRGGPEYVNRVEFRQEQNVKTMAKIDHNHHAQEVTIVTHHARNKTRK